MDKPADLGIAHLRVVRLSDDLAPVVEFYRDGLGFEVLSEFKDHEGFDGVILGHKEAAYHLAFTHKAGYTAGRAPTDDNLLVFYVPDQAEWERGVRRWSSWATNRSNRPIRTGITQARRSRTRTGIVSSANRRVGLPGRGSCSPSTNNPALMATSFASVGGCQVTVSICQSSF